MVYQFNSERAGTVIAEEKLESMSPYLGLRYPASDIPKQAKQLFTLNPSIDSWSQLSTCRTNSSS